MVRRREELPWQEVCTSGIRGNNATVALFRKHRAEPVAKAGETLVAARKRVLNVVKDTNVDSVSVRWNPR